MNFKKEALKVKAKIVFSWFLLLTLLMVVAVPVSAFWYSCPTENMVSCPTGCSGKDAEGNPLPCADWHTTSSPHRGVDIYHPNTIPMVGAAYEGRVVFAGDSGTSYGIMVDIKHWRSTSEPLSGNENVDEGNFFIKQENLTTGTILERWTRYAHLSSCMVKTNDSVSTNQDIGKMGNTPTKLGFGIHLHWEVRSNPYLTGAGWFHIHLSRGQTVSRGQGVWVDDGP